MDSQVSICCTNNRNRNRRRCCIDTILFILSLLLAFTIGLLIGAVTGLFEVLGLGAVIVLITLLVLAIIIRIIMLLCCKRTCC